MRVEIHSTSGGVTVESMPDEDVAALLSDYENGTSRALTVRLDEGRSVSHLARAHIVRIDVEEETA
ncbi:hypothetical protein SEA_KLEVEY_67 [Arthrobacter phage Klevey]|uniref:Uncharacterized protein n=1 Tax=Arthrobacter phage Klevey TaxID=2867481 RepID=A0AAE8XNP8_9CAUD|nr:hypothetical protein SEA_KLEVEY_67 [Arthrobacter phage Klevey]